MFLCYLCTGVSFNLNPLKKETGNYKYRNETLGYEFFINVCDTVKGDDVPCDPSKNPGACQHQLTE